MRGLLPALMELWPMLAEPPGANIQVQTNFQLITNAIDLEFSPQENAEAPRWQHLNGPSYSDAEENFNGVLQVESRVSQEVLEGLRKLGHEVQELSPYGHGSSVQLLEIAEMDLSYLAQIHALKGMPQVSK